MKYLLVVFLYFLVGCNTMKNMTDSDQYGQEKVNRTVCTSTELFVTHYTNEAVHFPKQQSLQLHRSDRGSASSYIKQVAVIDENTKFKIENVFYYNAPLCCGGFEVMAKINGETIDGKLVNISDLFNNIEHKNEPHSLISAYARYCE